MSQDQDPIGRATGSSASDVGVHEVWGPTLPPLQAAAALGMGVVGLLVLGVNPVLLGAMADSHALTTAQIGLAATAETLAMGVATAAMGLAGRPRRLRWIGAAACLALALCDLESGAAAGVRLIGLRVVCGALEGVLLWISVGMIARTRTPERWGGVFFTAQTAAQCLMALAFSVAVLPRWGAVGGYRAVALTAAAGALLALTLPRAYAALPTAHGAAGGPSPRGWLALAATVPFVAGAGAVAIYLQPLAREAGLSVEVARTALWTSLVAQVGGAAIATAIAGRVGYLSVFVGGGLVSLAAWALMAFAVPGWLFVADNIVLGLVSMIIAPFIAPMTIAADPSRRAALQTGAAQLLGGAMGPLLASMLVGPRDVHASLWIGGGLLIAGLIPIAALRLTQR